MSKKYENNNFILECLKFRDIWGWTEFFYALEDYPAGFSISGIYSEGKFLFCAIYPIGYSDIFLRVYSEENLKIGFIQGFTLTGIGYLQIRTSLFIIEVWVSDFTQWRILKRILVWKFTLGYLS